ncbi:hypothetical protein [uncultured Algibacter sp.]|uniref:hypothetical protein n=1 Tax=uncultured Algibacter sp. TaxID=298659 RepID=UPI00262F0867|nr:hypothetical protein [uncultured Algibacter sp.]
MKQLFLRTILLLFVALSFTNCNDEVIVNENNQLNKSNNTLQISKVTLDEIQQDSKLQSALNKIKEQFDYNKKSNLSLKTSDNSISILTDEIIHVKTDSTEAFTFRIDKLTHPKSSFENFIIEKRNDDEYRFFIYRYSQSKQKHKGENIYNLSRDLVENANITIVTPNNNASKYMYDEVTDCLYWSYTSSDCSCEITEIDTCGGGSIGGGSGGSTSGTGSSTSGGGTSSGGSSSGTSNGSRSTVGLLTPSETAVFDSIVNCLEDDLSNDALAWLQAKDQFEILPISNYLNDNRCSDGAKENIRIAIEGVISGESWSNLFPETLSNPKITDIVDYLKCFDLTKNATLKIYVDQPKANSSNTYRFTFNPFDPIDVGHTFISINQSGITRTMGYYPTPGTIDPTNGANSSTAILRNDGNHEYDVSLTTDITPSQLSSLHNKITNFNSTYDLNTYNCTDFGISIGNSIGLNLPDTSGTWDYGGNGSNPGNLGQDIRNMSLGSGVTKTTRNGNAPANTGTCP